MANPTTMGITPKPIPQGVKKRKVCTIGTTKIKFTELDVEAEPESVVEYEMEFVDEHITPQYPFILHSSCCKNREVQVQLTKFNDKTATFAVTNPSKNKENVHIFIEIVPRALVIT